MIPQDACRPDERLAGSLDPADWDEALARRMVDFVVAHPRDVRARPVWQPMPEDIRKRRLGYLRKFQGISSAMSLCMC
jgi:hypothetical protein